MNAYIDTIKVTDENGEKSILYPRTKQNAVEGLEERLVKLEVADITETEDTTLENSTAGRLLFTEIKGAMEQGANPSPTNPQEIENVAISGIRTHGKNFFDASKLTMGSLSSDTGIEGDSTAIKRTDFIPCTPSSNYTISGIANGVRMFFYDANKAFISTTVFEATNVIKSFVTPSNCAYIRMHDAIANWTDVVMLNAGTEATPYEPYTESAITFSQPIELYGLDDVRDILTNKQIKRKSAKVVFDGSDDEAWNGSSTIGRYYMNNFGCKGYGILMCSYAKGVQNGNELINTCYIHAASNGRFIINTEIPTMAEWKAHLASNPMTVVYEMAEETTEELPIADQIALNSLQTFDGITYVELISDVKPTYKAEYGTSKVGGYTLESLLVARNNDLRLSAVESAVVNNI